MTMSRRELLLRAGWTAGATALLLPDITGGHVWRLPRPSIPSSKRPTARCAAGASPASTVFLGSAMALPPEGRNRFMPPAKAAALGREFKTRSPTATARRRAIPRATAQTCAQ